VTGIPRFTENVSKKLKQYKNSFSLRTSTAIISFAESMDTLTKVASQCVDASSVRTTDSGCIDTFVYICTCTQSYHHSFIHHHSYWHQSINQSSPGRTNVLSYSAKRLFQLLPHEQETQFAYCTFKNDPLPSRQPTDPTLRLKFFVQFETLGRLTLVRCLSAHISNHLWKFHGNRPREPEDKKPQNAIREKPRPKDRRCIGA